jgi:hypothetical protein
VILLLGQPILGIMHHRRYKKLGRRTAWSTAHVWYGRLLMTIGGINGLLGLNLSGNVNGEIFWAVIEITVLFVYTIVVGAPVYAQWRKERSARISAKDIKVVADEDFYERRLSHAAI